MHTTLLAAPCVVSCCAVSCYAGGSVCTQTRCRLNTKKTSRRSAPTTTRAVLNGERVMIAARVWRKQSWGRPHVSTDVSTLSGFKNCSVCSWIWRVYAGVCSHTHLMMPHYCVRSYNWLASSHRLLYLHPHLITQTHTRVCLSPSHTFFHQGCCWGV